MCDFDLEGLDLQYFCYLSHTPAHPEDDNCQAEVRNLQQNYYTTLQLGDYRKAEEMDAVNTGTCTNMIVSVVLMNHSE